MDLTYQLKHALLDFDIDGTKAAAQAIVDQGLDPWRQWKL
jgi:hypothetical protein